MRAQTIQIFLPSGDPEGIRMASITTRTVKVCGPDLYHAEWVRDVVSIDVH